MTIEERIAKTVAGWPKWSKAERAKLPSIIDEVIDHCKNGGGNKFISDWCDLNLSKTFNRKSKTPEPDVPHLLDTICLLVRLVSQTCQTLEEESPGAAECGYWNHEQKMIYEDAKQLLRETNFCVPEDE